MNKFIQKCLSVLCCAMIVVTSFCGTVYADDYKKYDSSDDDKTDSTATYYIIEGEDFAKLFDFGLSDVKNLYDWIGDMRTYTVIKKYTNSKGEEVYKCYFNTPNLQQLAKNQVVATINDGYTDETYDVNQTEWIVNVGEGAGKVNVITRYGFNVPSYLYNGEYPKEIMTIAGVIPTGFWDTLWRAITALFGASFIKAPDASNFNTITYMNHGYTDKEDFLVDLIRKYYIPYFCARIAQDKYDEYDDVAYKEDYFSDVDDYLDEMITDAENAAAEKWINDNLELYKKIKRVENGYYLWKEDSDKKEKSKRFGKDYDTNAFADAKTSNYEDYLGISSKSDGIKIPLAHSDKGSGAPYWTDTKGVEPLYASFDGWILANSDYVDALKGWWDGGARRAAVIQSIVLADKSNPFYADFNINWNVTGNDVVAKVNDIFSDNEKFANFIMNVMNKSVPIGKLSYRYYYTAQGLTEAEALSRLKTAGETQTYKDFSINDADAKDGAMTLDWVYDLKNPSNKKEIEDYDKKEPKRSDYSTYDDWASAHSEWAKNKPSPEYKTHIKVDIKLADEPTVDHFIYDVPDGNVMINYNDVTSIFSVTLPQFKFTKDKWISDQMKRVMDDYEEAVDLTNDYDKFIEKVNSINKEKGYDPSKESMTGIAYNQCLITNKGADGECKNSDYGSEASITVSSLYAERGLYHDTPGFSIKQYEKKSEANYYTSDKYNPNKTIYEDYKTLTEEQAHKIINDIKDISGPYYSEVMANIVKLILLNAADEGDLGPAKLMHTDDIRVMPYDVGTLTKEDLENYAVADPRVEIYKDTLIGSFISSFTTHFSINFGGIFKLFAPQKTLLSIIGKVTEFSVFMQQLCNFDVLDSYGLSPTYMWKYDTGFAFLLISALTLFFIFKTVKKVIDLCRSGSSSDFKIIVGFLVLVVELGLVLAVSYNPEEVWSTVKNVNTKIINAGEMGTLYSDADLKYLYNGADSLEVTYYMPYLDAWSKYNTGYGILDEHQKIDASADLPELKEFTNPKLGDNDIGHWSVLLMDSFEYHGKSTSAYWSKLYYNPDTGEKENVNGININNNAYRVVDHFLAPRVELTEKSSGDIKLKTTTNENYNGEFQSGMAELFVKLLLALFVCFLSLLKLLIFFWQWYMYYIFFFEAILGKLAEKKTWGQIFLQTFAPTAALVFLGAYAGITLTIGMSLTGFLGMVMIILFFLLTLFLIGWWYRLGNGQYFPGTLKPIYALSTMLMAASMPNHRTRKEQRVEQEELDKLSDEDEELKDAFTGNRSLKTQMDALFNTDGTYKHARFSREKYDYHRGNLIDHFERKRGNGETTAEEEAFFARWKETNAEEYERSKLAYAKKSGKKLPTDENLHNAEQRGITEDESGKKDTDETKPSSERKPPAARSGGLSATPEAKKPSEGAKDKK